ncbi:MAG: GIY-YIG nuclease family protein, partial [Chlamydiia bacterium]|nr:GIY-YIG nuclease family protein [Chlamydiia bacterium]
MPYDSQKISKFPLLPGVYLMKGARSKILYIGKAKNLRLRVRQYFSGQDTRLMIPHLLKEVQDIEVIVVTSEKEALLLENTLIKQHKPKYNACLKDDKTYIS